MLMKMNTRLLLVACLGCIQGLHGQVITWSTDTATAFSVTVSGMGSGWSGSTTSPSGRWRFDHSGYHVGLSSLGMGFIRFYNFPSGGTVTFVPTGQYLAYEPYVQDVSNRLPVSDGSSAQIKPDGWAGVESMTVNSQPNPSDPSTWTYSITYSGWGPALLPPPGIVSPPQSTTANMGETVQFSATVYPWGQQKSLQWKFKGTNLPASDRFSVTTSYYSATTLYIYNVQVCDQGDYTLVASNVAGVVTSAVARLTVANERAWGLNGDGQTQVPRNAGPIVAIAAGAYHNLALRSDGRVLGWGRNDFGETIAPNDLTNAIAIAGGWGFSLALRTNHTVASWGWSAVDASRFPPDMVNITAVAAGWDHALALRTNGTVVAWGSNAHGQTNLPYGLSRVVAIAGGGNHSLALRQDGSVVGWGDNGSGQLNIPGDTTNVAMVAAGGAHSLALKWDGTVTGWGDNSYGQISAPLLLTNAVAIAAGGNHSLALRQDGSMVGWGDNSDGQLNFPVGLSNLVAVAAGRQHSVVLLGDGSPVVTVQPFNQAALPGDRVRFGLMAVGSAPFNYWWKQDGNIVQDGENSIHAIPSLASSDAGTYLGCAYYPTGGLGASAYVVSVPASLTLRAVWFGNVRYTQPGQMEMDIYGMPGDVWRVQASTDLFNWQTLCTMTNLADESQFIDPEAGNFNRRFYRCVMP